MEIRFSSPSLARVFNDMGLLTEAFGGAIARRIANRMAVLNAAANLNHVPRDPPIGCRQLDGHAARFAVDLAPSRLLIFVPAGMPLSRASAKVVLNRIKAIEIVSVE